MSQFGCYTFMWNIWSVFRSNILCEIFDLLVTQVVWNIFSFPMSKSVFKSKLNKIKMQFFSHTSYISRAPHMASGSCIEQHNSRLPKHDINLAWAFSYELKRQTSFQVFRNTNWKNDGALSQEVFLICPFDLNSLFLLQA